jgi:hypothetical protein
MKMRKTSAHHPEMSASRKEKRAISLAAAVAAVAADIAAAAKKPKPPAQVEMGRTRMLDLMSLTIRTNRMGHRWNRLRLKRSTRKLMSR